ncbi:MAG: hypothetical protein ACLFVS_03220 [Candidatus Acetothermia bacterium]
MEDELTTITSESLSLPEEAFDEDGKQVKYIFWRQTSDFTGPNGGWVEDSGTHFWVGDDPDKAPDGYELLCPPQTQSGD